MGHQDQLDQKYQSAVDRTNDRLNDIRAALAIDTAGMGQFELHEVWKLTQILNDRITCEHWGAKMGWGIPPYGTPEWFELQSAWLNSEDD